MLTVIETEVDEVTLSLTNLFNLTSSSSVSIEVSTDPNTPILSLIGPSYGSIVASSPLSVQSVAALSSCAYSDASIAFLWEVAVGSPAVPTRIKSSSLDPSTFLLPSYSLTVDQTYTITLTASTSTSAVSVATIVYVAHGVVTAVIVGGSYRSAPVDKVLLLDASRSYDSDYPPSYTSILSFKVKLHFDSTTPKMQ